MIWVFRKLWAALRFLVRGPVYVIEGYKLPDPRDPAWRPEYDEESDVEFVHDSGVAVRWYGGNDGIVIGRTHFCDGPCKRYAAAVRFAHVEYRREIVGHRRNMKVLPINGGPKEDA